MKHSVGAGVVGLITATGVSASQTYCVYVTPASAVSAMSLQCAGERDYIGPIAVELLKFVDRRSNDTFNTDT